METGAIVPAQPADLAALAEQANSEHGLAVATARNAIEHARKAGQLLRQAKEIVRHGQFGEWLATNFCGSRRTATNYMRLSARWEELPNRQLIADLDYSSAVKLLARPSPPEMIEPPQLSDDAVWIAIDRDGITYLEIWPDPEHPGRHAILRAQVWDAEHVTIDHDRRSVAYTPQLLAVALTYSYHIRPVRWISLPLDGRAPWFLLRGEAREKARAADMTRLRSMANAT